MKALTKWIADGTPWVWLNAAAVSACILLVVGLLILIGVRGMGHFWPLEVQKVVYQQVDGSEVILAGQIREEEKVTASVCVNPVLKLQKAASSLPATC